MTMYLGLVVATTPQKPTKTADTVAMFLKDVDYYETWVEQQGSALVLGR